jgi:hypothetical protein
MRRRKPRKNGAMIRVRTAVRIKMLHIDHPPYRFTRL